MLPSPATCLLQAGDLGILGMWFCSALKCPSTGAPGPSFRVQRLTRLDFQHLRQKKSMLQFLGKNANSLSTLVFSRPQLAEWCRSHWGVPAPLTQIHILTSSENTFTETHKMALAFLSPDKLTFDVNHHTHEPTASTHPIRTYDRAPRSPPIQKNDLALQQKWTMTRTHCANSRFKATPHWI